MTALRAPLRASRCVAARLRGVTAVDLSAAQVDVSPLAPGCGLLLDEIKFFDVGKGVTEYSVPPRARSAMEAFKTETLYAHVHGLYEGGAFRDFVSGLRDGTLTKHYAVDDFDKLRRVRARWDEHCALLIEQRRQQRSARRGAPAAAEGGKSGARGVVGAGGEVGGSASGASKGEASRRTRRQLPGGLLVALCVRRELEPGPETHALLEGLRERLEAGELLERQDHEYYLGKLPDPEPEPGA